MSRVHEDKQFDEAQMATWIRQAAALPGWDGASPRLYGGVPLQDEMAEVAVPRELFAAIRSHPRLGVPPPLLHWG